MLNKITHYRFVLFACLLLVVTPVLVNAQDDEQETEVPRNKAWLAVYIDPHGAAKASLEFPAEVRDREPLKRALAESFSFPVEFPDVRENESDGKRPWTTISARSPKAFSGGMLETTCRIDLRFLLPQLEQHQIEHLKVMVFFQNGTQDIEISGAERLALGSLSVDHYDADVDVRAGAVPVIEFAMGYKAGAIFKRSAVVVLFLLLPVLWTSLYARKASNNPEELWGRHLRFLHRLLNVVWMAWLPVYFFSGVSEIISFAFGADRRGVGQIVNIAFYFIPPVIAMFLCHVASRRVYEQVPAVDWSPREVVRQAIIANALTLVPMFLVIVGMYTFSSSARQAALYVIVGYIGFVVLSQNMARLLGSRLHALTSGDLRDRIFDLGHRAGVKLQQVYVLPETRAQLSNAFARSDNSVMITNSLLKNLSRREVDGIIAHEIGHLQAKHPHTSTTIMIVVIVVANFVGIVITKIANLQNATPLVFAAAVAVAYLVVFFRSRRNERQADAIGISLTGDPEAFISGLAKLSRLNLMPLHSGGWGESLDTHPGALSRFQEIAKAYGIKESRLQELMTDTEIPHDRYPSIDDEVDTTVFSSEYKNKYRVRVAVTFIGVMVLAPVPFAILIARDGASYFSLLGNCVAGFIWSFAVMEVVRNRMSCWGYDSLGSRLKMKLNKHGLGDAARHGTLVGLAPAAETRRYEGYSFWDIGVLWLTKEKLFYIGEQCQFALERGEVNEVYSRDTDPQWHPEKSLFIRWKEYPEGPGQTLHFVATGEVSISKSRRAIELLQQRLQAWMYESVSFMPASRAAKSIPTPAFPEITSTLPPTRFDPGLAFKTAIQLGVYGAVVGFAIRLSYTSIAYMAAVAFLLALVDELPKAFKRELDVTQVIPPTPSFESGTYQSGSWKNA